MQTAGGKLGAHDVAFGFRQAGIKLRLTLRHDWKREEDEELSETDKKRQRIEPKFCNEKRTATKKALKKADSIHPGQAAEITEWVFQTGKPIMIFLFRCGFFFVASLV